MTEKTGSLGRQVGSAMRWNGAAGGATVLSQFLQLIVLARWLSPAEFGLAATAISIAGFAQGLTDFGLTNALVQRPQIESKAWASALWACLLGGTLLFVGLSLASPLCERLLALKGLAPLLCVAAFTLPWAGPSSVFQADLQRRLHFSRLARAEIVAAIASLCAALGWALWRREAMALVAGQVALISVRCIFLAFASPLRPAPRLRFSDLRPLASFGGYQMGDRVLNYAAGNMDRLLVARLLGAAAAGYYTVASQIALRPLALLTPFVFRTLFPVFARLQEEKERLAFSLIRTLSLLSLLSAGLYALLFGLAGPLSVFVLGTGWGPIVPVLRVLTGVGFLWAVSTPLASLTLALGRAGAGFWINALALAMNATAVLIGSRYGIRGVAWGMVLSVLLSMPVDFVLAKRWIGIAPGRLMWAMGWAVPMAVLAVLAMQTLYHPVLALGARNSRLHLGLELGLKGILGCVVFAAAAWILQPQRVRDAVSEVRAKLPDRFQPK
jgi:lipopolysaccharide exporter